MFAVSYKTPVAAGCRARQGFSFERSVSVIPFSICRHGCGQPDAVVPAKAEHHGWRADVDSCCESLTTGEGHRGLSRTQREWWRAASRVRLTAQCVA